MSRLDASTLRDGVSVNEDGSESPQQTAAAIRRGDPRSPAEKRGAGHAGWLSRRVREEKLCHFMSFVAPEAKILDFGCAGGWVSDWAIRRGWTNIVGVDLEPPADIVGDIHDWKDLGLQAHSFDAIIAFEVVEHGDFATVLRELLRPEGLLLATTPVPKWDWLCQAMERARVLQARTGPHVNLLDLRALPGFQVVDFRIKGLVAQWAVLKPA